MQYPHPTKKGLASEGKLQEISHLYPVEAVQIPVGDKTKKQCPNEI